MNRIFLSLSVLSCFLFTALGADANPVHSRQCAALESIPVGLLSDNRVLMSLSQLAANNAGIEGSRLDVFYCVNSPEKGTYLFVHTGYEMPGPGRSSQHVAHFDVNMYVVQGSSYVESVGMIEQGSPIFGN